ncbi:uncharacterized protein [Blastocystis hominis]|uniref:Condensin complex subunit 1 C-terminal domain-containing protein n=1 Tax=Blastocystis hominis TaxID=12968 RepID=D8LXL6_BLAHO|nr:uncharacterized protein [Blastocystis hominis]CBK20321.2 unnamed protein product [Blastocystis hominis]|eukprot:XP_012894369.1 uncharacterized protein [Blastocystis hominis]
MAVHASSSKVFSVLKLLMGSFVHYRKHKELWTRLTELYEPILFRSLSVSNAIVRRHAAILFIDCFPLGTSEARDTYSIEDQFKAILVLCDDETPDVRSVAVAGVLHLICNYFELLPVSVTSMILEHVTTHLMHDVHVEVRELCLRGLLELLDNRLVYKVLFPHIAKLWPFLFDRSLRVRKSFLQLLIKLQNIKSFDLSAVFVLDDFLRMLRFDHTANPTNSINRLYTKFLTPLFWKEVSFIRLSANIEKQFARRHARSQFSHPRPRRLRRFLRAERRNRGTRQRPEAHATPPDFPVSLF